MGAGGGGGGGGWATNETEMLAEVEIPNGLVAVRTQLCSPATLELKVIPLGDACVATVPAIELATPEQLMLIDTAFIEVHWGEVDVEPATGAMFVKLAVMTDGRLVSVYV